MDHPQDSDDGFFDHDDAHSAADAILSYLLSVEGSETDTGLTAGTVLYCLGILEAAFLRLCVEGGLPPQVVLHIRVGSAICAQGFFVQHSLEVAAEHLRAAKQAEGGAEKAAKEAIRKAIGDVKAGWIKEN